MAAPGLSLSCDEKIPNLITLDGERIKALGAALDAEFVGEDAHVGSVLCSSTIQIKNASRGYNHARRSHFSTAKARFLPAVNGDDSARESP